MPPLRLPALAFATRLAICAFAASSSALAFAAAPTPAPETERLFLSGEDAARPVSWEFSVTGGRRAGEQTTIPVPSMWELHGFGTYNYGEEILPKADEHGLYRTRFAVPETWKGRRIRLVFEGVMTDATVKVNGESAGPTHHGAFYRFHYDITALVKLGSTPENVLEVDVAKRSADARSDRAERDGDYWVMGGIFRPVWLEAAPAQSIEHTAIDARADGTFRAEVQLATIKDATRLDAQIATLDGQPVGAPFSTRIPAGGAGRVQLATKIDAPRLWSAETPHLYRVHLTLRQGDEILHTTTERFGFRTFEVRPGEGLFLNGERILLRGVNRHSFRPDTGRALSREDCYADARLIRSMNMNAARMSHYPPDKAFLEAADELGLYVINELSGWHRSHGTQIGRRLVRAMIERDVNHPSILFWDNGNEGGWNRELDGDFALHDPQKRRVLHPWELHDDVDTKHYPNYDDITTRLRGPHLVMPTEFIHSLYDGGGGAALEDYWNAISSSPVGAGGFHWVFADEGLVRSDQNGRIDVYGTYAPDGLVGPRHEKEGSYYTVRDLWSPVQIAAPVLDDRFNGQLAVTNHYDFTTLDQCRFAWRLIRFADPNDTSTSPAVLAEGTATAPAIAPDATGQLALALPANWRDADALTLTAFDPNQQELWTWTWPAARLTQRIPIAVTSPTSAAAPTLETVAGEIRLRAGDTTATFDAITGLLRTVRRGDRAAALTAGPRLVFARPETAAEPNWLAFAHEDATTQTRRFAEPQLLNTIDIELDYARTSTWAGFKLEISPDGHAWKTLFDGTRRVRDGTRYNFPPQPVSAFRLSHLRQADGSPIAVKSVRAGYAPRRFPAPLSAAAQIATGTTPAASGRAASAWLETRGAGGFDHARWTLHPDGSLQLDYAYTLNGEFLYHGVTFDHPEADLRSLRWLGAGPYRVWQNRLRGTWLGVHEIARNDPQPGEAWTYPEFQGYFAGFRWARFDTTAGPLTFASASPDVYLRVGTPRLNHQNTAPDFPAGDLSFLHAIPAIGSKFVTPEKSGPSGLPAKASGTYRGTLRLEFGAPTQAPN